MNRLKKTIITTAVALTTVAMIAPATAGAVTIAELQAQINALLAQLATLQGGSSSAACTFARSLFSGVSGDDVKCLQQWLNANGYPVGSGLSTGYYGSLTVAAVAKYQVANGISPAVGYFGPLTRASVVAKMGSSPTSPTSPTTPTGLTGGAGDITVSSLSTYSSQNVGEGQNDVKVAAFEIEADSSSDVAINSMKVELYQQTAADSRDMDDYIKNVSIWMDSTEIGRANVSEFSDAANANEWVKSVTTSNAVVKKGMKNKFYIAVSANNSIDSGDRDSDDWHVGVSSVRFIDGSGVTTTESLTLDINDDTVDDTVEQAFNFASSLTSNSVELKVALKDEDKHINKGHLVNAKSGSADNDDIALLSFTMEAKGDSINVQEFPVVITSSGETDEAVLIKAAHLYRGSTKLGTETVPTGGAVTFDNLDFTLTSGSKDSFQIRVDVQDLTGALDEADSIKAEMTSGVLDSGIVAEDSTKENLTSSEISGSALGELVVFRDVGFTLTLVSTSAVVSHAGDVANSSDHDQGTFKIVMDVTAWDGDIYIDSTAPDSSGGVTESDLTYTGSPTETSGSITCTSGSCTSATNSLKIADGQTGRITITRVLTAASDALVDVALADLLWDTSDQSGTLPFGYNLTDFKTPQVFLNLDQS